MVSPIPRTEQIDSTIAMELSLQRVNWQHLTEEGRSWLESSPLSPGDGRLVKLSHHRRVIQLPGGIFVKEIHYRGLRSLLKLVTGGNAWREGRTLLELARRNVQVPRVLGIGVEYRRGMLERDLLITREVSGARALSEFVLQEFDNLPFSQKKQCVVHFAAFIRHLHDRGVMHTDLHIGNILLQGGQGEGRFVLLDADRVKLKSKPLTHTERVRNLGLLLGNFWTLDAAPQHFRFHFLKHYLAADRIAREGKFIESIAQSTLEVFRNLWKNHARRCLFNNKRFVHEKRHGFSILRVRGGKGEAVLQELLPDPDRVLEQGTVLKDGRTIKAARVELGGEFYFLKRYNCKGWVYRVRNALRRSRAVRTWLTSWAFRVRGLPVPEPLICLEERRFRLLERSYILSRYVANAECLSDVWPRLDGSQRRGLLARLAMLLGRMHRFGAIHGDLKWQNIILQTREGGGAITLTDLDGSRIMRPVNLRRPEKDLARWLRDLEERDEAGVYKAFFLHSWRKWLR
jgi:tRNA A-37 threonylcarbamoyl transferase component Bud32